MGEGLRNTRVVPAKAGTKAAFVKQTLGYRLVTKISGNDEIKDPGVSHFRNDQ